MSSYNYSFNNPVMFTDPSGKGPNGVWYYHGNSLQWTSTASTEAEFLNSELGKNTDNKFAYVTEISTTDPSSDGSTSTTTYNADGTSVTINNTTGSSFTYDWTGTSIITVSSSRSSSKSKVVASKKAVALKTKSESIQSNVTSTTSPTVVSSEQKEEAIKKVENKSDTNKPIEKISKMDINGAGIETAKKVLSIATPENMKIVKIMLGGVGAFQMSGDLILESEKKSVQQLAKKIPKKHELKMLEKTANSSTVIGRRMAGVGLAIDLSIGANEFINQGELKYTTAFDAGISLALFAMAFATISLPIVAFVTVFSFMDGFGLFDSFKSDLLGEGGFKNPWFKY
jgi:hypothetical protein